MDKPTTSNNTPHIQVSTLFRFESAHRLAKGYRGKCANIHGHSWQGELAVSTNTLDHMDIAIDYCHLKEFLDPLIKSLDHTLLLYENDTKIITLCKNQNWDIITFKRNPTSEALAEYIFNEAITHFKSTHPKITVDHILIEETCTSKCYWKAPKTGS
jgi:6-pyruvoyltetrahydropterin/6-carboxytetrahydropterin synthase